MRFTEKISHSVNYKRNKAKIFRIFTVTSFSCLMVQTIYFPRPALANEVMTDRCSASVVFPRAYTDSPSSTGSVHIHRNRYGVSNWTKPFRVSLGSAGHIRWFCKSTKGNTFDLGTWRPSIGGLFLKCNPFSFNCKPDVKDFGIGSSAIDGYTPERSRCNSRGSLIRARLGTARLLQIECLE